MNQAIFYLIIGAFGAEILRMIAEEIINCIRFRRNSRKLELWLAETHAKRQAANFREVEKFGEEDAK